MVNNVTNLTLLLGLPAMVWGLNVFPKGKNGKQAKGQTDRYRINRLSLLLSLTALVFFTGLLRALTRDGLLDFNDGLVLTGGFLFWQIFHVFEVLKENVQKNRSFSWWLPVDFSIIIGAGYTIYVSIERLVAWMPEQGTGLLDFTMIGWLSGLLMVLPNALLAFYYAAKNRAEIVYSSQIGDGHICIPLCIGLFALFKPIRVPAFFDTGIYILLGAAGFHFICLIFLRQLPRTAGFALTGVYGYFLIRGFFSLMS